MRFPGSQFWLKILVFLLLLCMAYLLLAFYAGKKLQGLLVQTLNEQLAVKVEVQSIDLDVFRHFPNISVRFNQVKVHESKAYYGNYLLEAPQLSLVFHPLKIYGEKIEVRKLLLNKGKLRLHSFDDGSNNFDVFKPDEGADDTRFDLNLRDVRLQKTNLVFTDEDGMSMNLTTGQMRIQARLSEKQYNLKLKGNFYFDHLMNAGRMLLFGKTFLLEGQMQMQSDASAFFFQQLHCQVEALKLKLDGNIRIKEEVPHFELKYAAENLDIQQLLSLLPSELPANVAHLRSEGLMNLEGSLNGPLNDTLIPGIQLRFKMEKGRIFSENNTHEISNISLKGELNSPPFSQVFNPQWALNIQKAKLGAESLQCSFKPDEDGSVLLWSAKGGIDLQEFSALLELPDSLQMKGQIKLNLKSGVPLNDSTSALFYLDGDLIAKDLQLPETWLPLKLKEVYADLHFDPELLTINKISARSGASDVLFKGQITGYEGWFSGSSGSLIMGELFSNSLYVKDFIPETSASTQASEEEAEDSLSLPEIQLAINCRKFSFDPLVAEQFQGMLRYANETWTLSRAAARMWKGQVLLDGTLKQIQDSSALEMNLDCKDLDIQKIFIDFENFGQEELTDKHLSGKLSGRFLFQGMLDENGAINTKSMQLISHLIIRDGRLKDYEPLYDLSKFVSLKELSDIRFDVLENDIEISNEEIRIPQMRIKNSALDLELSGTHRFDQYMQYHFGVEVSELLAGKAQWLQKAKGENLEKTRPGRVKIFIYLEGTPEDLNLRYDTKISRKQNREKIEKKSNTTIRERLKESVQPDDKSGNPATDDWWDE